MGLSKIQPKISATQDSMCDLMGLGRRPILCMAANRDHFEKLFSISLFAVK